MTSVKCPQCGLVYWSTAENCRRCGVAADDPTAQPDTQVLPTKISDDDAERLLGVLNKCSRLFYFIGGLQILAWFFLGNLLVFDGVCNIGLSYVANKFKSRIAAGLLLLLTLLSVLIAFLAMAMGAMRFNLFTPLVLIWRLGCSIRMVHATFKLNAYEAVDVTRMMPPLPPLFPRENQSQWTQPVASAQWLPE